MDEPLLDRLFLGAGAMKAGTTWLYSVLATHPEIYFSPEKEIHYFYARHVRPDILSEPARLENVKHKYLGFEPRVAHAGMVRNRLRWAANYLDGPVDDHWYRGLFSLRRHGAWCADFSNLYALLPEAAWARIAARVGMLRVIYTMRDPVERLWSHAKFHLKLTGQDDALDRWSPVQVNRFLRQDHIWENSEYGAAIRRMRAGLPDPDALLLVFHEDLHADETAGLRRIEEHLDLSPHDYPAPLLARKVNTTPRRPVPEWFRELVAEDARRIVAELRAEGLLPPQSWLERDTLPEAG